MIERYIIQSILYPGYFWSEKYNDMSNIMEASQYISENDARNTIVSKCTIGRYQIIKIYIK